MKHGTEPERPRGQGIDTILHVITGLDVGGAELALKRLVLADRRAEVRHLVVSLRDVGIVGRELSEEGVEVHALGMRGPWTAIRGFVRLVRVVAGIAPAVVQTWMYHGDLFGGLAARLAGRREIIWGIRQSGFAPGASLPTRAAMRVCALLSFWIPRLIVCCAESARASHVAWGYCERKMRVIPNGFDVPPAGDADMRRHPLREQLGLTEDRVVVGMVGRFDPLKNHRGFIEAARAVAERHPAACFLLVGRNVDCNNAQLQRWIREAGLESRTILLGERRDVMDCMAAMDVFCLPSLREGFPNVVGEAMALAMPCVVTDTGDAASIVGEAGWVVSPDDAQQLGATLCEVIALPAQRRREIGLAARARILEKFSMARTRESFENAYRELRARVG